VKTQIAAAALEALKTQRISPPSGIERVFVADFLYH